jgi:hypothetical protein
MALLLLLLLLFPANIADTSACSLVLYVPACLAAATAAVML